MKLHDFPRYPLTFGPSPIHELDRLTQHLGWSDRLGQARGLQLRARLRRQQDPQAGVHRPRRTRQGSRHVGLDRRRPVKPHPPGRRRRGQTRPEVPPRPGEVGRLGRPGQRQGRQHPAFAHHGRRRAARPGRLRHRHPQSWEDALREVEEAGGKPYAIPAGASEHPLGGLGFANWAFEVAEQEKQLGVFFDTIVVCTVTGSTHAGMIAGFAALQEAPTTAHAGCSASMPPQRSTRPATRSPESPVTRRNSSSSAATCATTRSPSSRAGPATYYGIPVESTVEAIRLCGSLEGMIIDPVYEGKSMAGLIDLVTSRGDRPGLHRPLRPPRRPAGPQRLLRHLRLRTSSPTVMASRRSLMNADDVTGSSPDTRPIGGASGVTSASWLAS